MSATYDKMDRIIEDKRLIKPKHWKFIVFGVIILTFLLIFIFRDTSSVYRLEKEKLTIEEVTEGPFNDYIRINGIVEPISFIYLDAIESGRVEKILIEEGSMVNEGDIILQLSNNNLNLSILNSEAQLAEKANFLRDTRINMEQQKLNLQRELLRQEHDLVQKKRTYIQNKELFKDELISEEEFKRSKEDYDLALKLKELTLERHKKDSIFRENQVEKISKNLENMQRNLNMIYQRQENLNVKAPVDGLLGLLNAELGQSIGNGIRIGRIDVLTNYKIKADIDEHYIDKIKKGLIAQFERQGDTFKLELTKVYPDVRSNMFEINLRFLSNLPENIRIGQTYYISLQLGEPSEAIQVPKGGFYQSTGGQWVYVLSPDETFCVKRDIRIGKQNPQHYEVIEGLMPGEKVVTSNYDIFKDNDKLVFK